MTNDDRLTITLTGEEEFIEVAPFLSVVENTVAILREIDIAISDTHKMMTDWRIGAVSLNSPLAFTVVADSRANQVQMGRQILDVCLSGFRQIEAGTKCTPAYFTEEALERAKKVVSTLNNGIARIAISTPWGKPFVASQHMAATIDKLLPKEHDELGTLEGKLETLSVHGNLSFAIWDVMTGARIECRFPENMLAEAHEAFTHRVAVYGKVRYSRTGKPKTISVQELKRLRSQGELMQAKDLETLRSRSSNNSEWGIREID